ncbi:hypothetical protein OSCT_0928 [Oscillochloris trichoides DG-6]|uniref:Uncharacterized protein n=1 Tax=Oscillochloris trichoides DG-6 TaxID=765420 RepID=E1IC77_9CHLR|nr:hypothetical protein [Oscillochloris trichoides]EFO81194.1 hypothetical protein OSCT_0928 [Oscillochloris trichoides DG-6]
MEQPLIWLKHQFTRHEFDFEVVNNEAIRSGFRIELASGRMVEFPLLAFEFEDMLGNSYIRLSINPLVERHDQPLPAAMAQRIAHLNHEAAWVRLTIDSDGDLELCGDLPIALAHEQAFDLLLQALVDYASVIYEPAHEFMDGREEESAPSNDLQGLAQHFAQQYHTELNMDYSVESLERFEANIDDEYRDFLRTEGLLDANTEAFGAYIGEVLVHQGTGAWNISEPRTESSVEVGSRRYQPLRMARAFLESSEALRPSALIRRALVR